MVFKKYFLPALITGLVVIYSNLSAQWITNGQLLTTVSEFSHIYPQSTADTFGNFYLMWNEIDTSANGGNARLLSFKQNGSINNGWSNDGTLLNVLGTDNFTLAEPVISNDGNIICVWSGYTAFNVGSSDIYIQKVDTSGNLIWNNNVPVKVSNQATNNNIQPKIVPDRDGGCYIFWESFDLNNSRQDIYGQHILADGTIDVGWNAMNSNFTNSPNDNEIIANVLVDYNSNSLYLLYGKSFIDSDLELMKINATTGVLESSFGSSGILAISDEFDSRNTPHLSFDSNGNLLLLWIGFVSTGEVYFQKVTTAGVKFFAPNGQPVFSQSTGDMAFMESIKTSDNLITFAWTQVGGLTGNEVHMHQINNDAQLTWSSLVSLGPQTNYPKLTLDYDSGFYVFHRELQAPGFATTLLKGLKYNEQGNLDSDFTLPGSTMGGPVTTVNMRTDRDVRVSSAFPGMAFAVWQEGGGGANVNIKGCNLLANAASCIDTFVYEPTITLTSLNSYDNHSAKIYPNPFDDIIVLDAIQEIQDIEFLDLNGSIVYEKEFDSNHIIVNSSSFDAGIYILNILLENGSSEHFKVVKK